MDADPAELPPATNGSAPYTLIRDLPQSERPRERLRDSGANALSTSELLAILLRTGSTKESALAQAQRLLREFSGLAGLHQAPFSELRNVHGLGEAKAAQIKAAIELGLRLASADPEERATIRSPEDVADLWMAEMSLLEQEHVRVLLLDTRNRVIARKDAYRGSVHTAQVRIAEMFKDAIRANAAAIVAVHNHPSGDPTPSQADAHMTRSLVDAGKLLDIDVVDHIVIGGGRYVSMKRLDLGFSGQGETNGERAAGRSDGTPQGAAGRARPRRDAADRR